MKAASGELWRLVGRFSEYGRTKRVENPIMHRAQRLWAQGRKEDADMLMRSAFARGEQGEAIDAAVNRINHEVLSRGIEFKIPSAYSEDKFIESADDAGNLLQRCLKTMLTLADFADILDVGSPVVELSRLNILFGALNEKGRLVTLDGEYQLHDAFRRAAGGAGVRPIRYYVRLTISNGKVKILSREIIVSMPLRRMGFGARSMLSLALFAARHGIESWRGVAQDEGRFAWAKIAASVARDSLGFAISRLEKLVETGAVRGLDLSRIDPGDIRQIESLMIEREDVISRDDFCKWLVSEVGLGFAQADGLEAPYPVGTLALRSEKNLFIRYETDAVLRDIFEYLPRRIAEISAEDVKDGIALHMSRDPHAMANIGLFMAYRRGADDFELMRSVIVPEEEYLQPEIIMAEGLAHPVPSLMPMGLMAR